MPQICIFEDQPENYYPIALTRPVYFLNSGSSNLLSRILQYFPKHQTVLHMRKKLVPIIKEQTCYKVNELEVNDTIFVNGKVLADKSWAGLVLSHRTNFIAVQDGRVVAAKLSAAKVAQLKIKDVLDFSVLKIPEIKLKTNVANYLWDLVISNGDLLKADFTGGRIRSDIRQAKVLNKQNLNIGENCKFGLGVVLDASKGPIIIGNEAEIMHNSVIIGPVYIGNKSIIKVGAKIYGNTSIGPACKIGGEVEGSIIQGYSNKQHEGFLGHAFLGEWVNLGAGTENSDLKNNYGNVEVYLDKKNKVETKQRFVGCFIGDHTKTGIKTMINTGSSFGPFCNIFGAGYQPKYLPEFSWQDNDLGKTIKYDQSKALATAEIVMSRRGVRLSAKLKDLYAALCDK